MIPLKLIHHIPGWLIPSASSFIWYCIIDTHIHHDIISSGRIIWLQLCQWCNPEEYGNKNRKNLQRTIIFSTAETWFPLKYVHSITSSVVIWANMGPIWDHQDPGGPCWPHEPCYQGSLFFQWKNHFPENDNWWIHENRLCSARDSTICWQMPSFSLASP